MQAINPKTILLSTAAPVISLNTLLAIQGAQMVSSAGISIKAEPVERPFITGLVITSITTPAVASGITLDKLYNLLSGFKDSSNGDIPDYGLFKVGLEAKVERSSSTVDCSSISNKRQTFYVDGDFDPKDSKYWFINILDHKSLTKTDAAGNPYLPLDTELCLADELYRTYPNILPGYLYVKIQPELPDNFDFTKNISTGIKSPNLYVLYDYEVDE